MKTKKVLITISGKTILTDLPVDENGQVHLSGPELDKAAVACGWANRMYQGKTLTIGE